MKKMLFLLALVVAMSNAQGSQYVFRYDHNEPGDVTVELYNSWQDGAPFETIKLDDGVNRQRTVGTTDNLDHFDVINHKDGRRYRFSFSQYRPTVGAPLNLTISLNPSLKTIQVRDNNPPTKKTAKMQQFRIEEIQ